MNRETEELVDLLQWFVAGIRAHFTQVAASFDLTAAQAKALLQVDAPRSMRYLAAQLGWDASNMTSIVDALEARELVERQTDPGDRRIKNAVLTDSGTQLRRRLRARLYADVPGLDRLSPEHRRALRAILREAVGEQRAGSKVADARAR